jgi:hypothetical protein
VRAIQHQSLHECLLISVVHNHALIHVSSEPKTQTIRELLVRFRALIGGLILFALNVYLCHELFHREFTIHMDSIESSYMGISQWATNHWGDLRWFPLWHADMPFLQVYQPGFHLTVAALASLADWTVQHSFHFVSATVLALSPVTLFVLCYRVTKWAEHSFFAGLVYSVISPSSMLARVIREDTENLITGRRAFVLMRYGEGPHLAALMMLPLVILAVHYAAVERRRWAIAAAPVALAALVLTNWPGTIGLSMALTAYGFSRFGSKRAIHWPTMLILPVRLT